MLPVLIGIVGEGQCDGSRWQSSLQQKIHEILSNQQKQFSSTPLFLLCNRRNDFEKVAFEAAIQHASGSMNFPAMDYETIAKNSQILVCIHKDKEDALESLIEIRHGKSKDVTDVRGMLYQRERGPVWEMKCAENGVDAQVRYPQHPSEKDPSASYNLIWKNMEQFNRDAQKAPTFETGLPLLPETTGNQLSAAELGMLKQFEICDRMAAHYQKRTYSLYLALFVFSFAYVFFYDIYGNLVKGAPFRVPFYIASLAIAVLIYWFGKRKNYENKYFDYRALAEGLRVQFFWSLVDLPRTVADYYLHKSENELIWIRAALRSWYTTAQNEDDSSNLSKAERLQIILHNWIHNQNDYFFKTGMKNKRQLKFLKRGSTVLLALAFVLTVLKLPMAKPPSWLLVTTTFVAAVGALVKGYIQNRGLSEHLKQYSRMAELYGFALDHTTMLQNEENANLLIQELGKEALAENAEWVLLHRDRRISFPGPK